MRILIDSEVQELISSLEKKTAAKSLRTIDLLEKFGHKLGMPHSKNIGINTFELRVRGRQEVRIFYCFHGKAACLIHAFIKKSKKTPLKDLRQAKEKVKRLTSI